MKGDLRSRSKRRITGVETLLPKLYGMLLRTSYHRYFGCKSPPRVGTMPGCGGTSFSVRDI